MSVAEERLRARGIAVSAEYTVEPDRPDIHGVFHLYPFPDQPGGKVSCVIRPDLTPEQRAGFFEYVEARLAAYFEVGPERDGWSDWGAFWELRVRDVPGLPDMGFLAHDA